MFVYILYSLSDFRVDIQPYLIIENLVLILRKVRINPNN